MVKRIGGPLRREFARTVGRKSRAAQLRRARIRQDGIRLAKRTARTRQTSVGRGIAGVISKTITRSTTPSEKPINQTNNSSKPVSSGSGGGGGGGDRMENITNWASNITNEMKEQMSKTGGTIMSSVITIIPYIIIFIVIIIFLKLMMGRKR